MYDIHVSRLVTPQEASLFIAEAFEIETGQCTVVNDVEDLDDAINWEVWCVLCSRDGLFPTSLEVYPSASRRRLEEAEIARRASAHFKAECLISDESENPYAWQLVDQAGRIEAVSIDPDAFAKDQFVLPGRRPTSRR